MSRTSMPTRAISVLLAFVLACTMVPTTSIAYASEAGGGSAAANASSAAAENAGEGAESAAAEAGSADEAAGNADQAADAGAAEGEAPAADAAAAPVVTSEEKPVSQAPEADDMLQANVSLTDARTVLTSGNLTYTVNDDDQTVTLTGWTGAAPKGTLSIPTQVSLGDATYQVTNIGSHEDLGGGVFAECGF